MNNDIFFMSCAVLSVWSKGGLKKTYGIVAASKDNELLKVFCSQRTKFSSEIEFILNTFGSTFNFTETTLYVTFAPSKNFFDAAKSKKVKRIVYLPLQDCGFKDEILEPFKYNFGKVVDLFSVYKIPENV